MCFNVLTVYEIEGPALVCHATKAVTIPANSVKAVKIEFAGELLRDNILCATLAARQADLSYHPMRSTVTARHLSGQSQPMAEGEAAHVTREETRHAMLEWTR